MVPATEHSGAPGRLDEPADRGPLLAVLTRARGLGFLGPGPVEEQIERAFWFGRALGEELDRPGVLLADLGAGGGLPSLPLLWTAPGLRAVLVEALGKRASFLVWASVELGMADRVTVFAGRAEELAHEPGRREGFDVVVARGFGPPAWTLECAGPLLRMGGRVAVSEPPEPRSYPAEGLARCGLAFEGVRQGCAVFVRSLPVGAELPRSAARQRKKPLFEL